MLEPQPGTIVADKLRLLRPLGQGGMGSVWVAEHVTLETTVAVKFIRPERAATDPTLVQRFDNEAKAAARLASPHVVRIHDYGLEDGTPYLVMELLEGRSLDAVLAEDGRMKPLALARVVRDVAEALEAAHHRDIVHRDIKPQNIFLTEREDGRPGPVKVLDFGVAKVVSEASVPGGSALTATGTVIGSPPYMSPEQLEGRRDIDLRADLWSLAVVAYQCLTGRMPFEGDSFVRVGAAVLAGRYTPVTEHREGLPESIDDWFAKCLSVDVEGRFATARAMAEALLELKLPVTIDDGATPSVKLAHATTEKVRADVPSVTGTAPTPALAPAPDVGQEMGQEMGETTSSIAMDARPSPSRRWRGPVTALLVAGAAVGGWLALRPPASPSGPPASPASPTECPEGTVFFPEQTFDMGSPEGDDVPANETPKHRVSVRPFCIDRTEVTVGAYRSCSGCDPLETTIWGREVTSKGRKFWSAYCNGGLPGRDDHPVNCVSWKQAQAYCVSRGGRLPSEEEWELAARGSDGRRFPWGNDPPNAERVNACGAECSQELTARREAIGAPAWPALHEVDDGAPSTTAVGSHPTGASPSGLLDMAGNVWEWTASPYCNYDEGSCGEARRVLRGGGWDTVEAAAVSVTRRLPGDPTARGRSTGFRCAFTLGD